MPEVRVGRITAVESVAGLSTCLGSGEGLRGRPESILAMAPTGTVFRSPRDCFSMDSILLPRHGHDPALTPGHLGITESDLHASYLEFR